MMDYESASNSDFIHDKISKTIEKSSNLLHKKAIALVKGLKEQLGSSSSGIEGIKNYIKNVLDLIDVLFKKISNPRNYSDQFSFEEDLKNSEALLFTLAVCIKQLPFALLRNVKICERIIFNVESFIKLSHLITFKTEIKKYSIIISEKLLMSRNESELKDDNDFVTKFFSDLFFTLLEEASAKSDDALQKCLMKSLCKIFKTPNMLNILKMSLLLQIKTFLVKKIRGLNIGKDFEGTTMKLIGDDSKIKQISTSEGESVLKFLCSILQFLPFDLVNDLILELTDMIIVSENKHILLNSLLCFEVAFNTKSFALETNEKIINLLLSKDFLINANDTTDFDTENRTSHNKVDINTSLTVAFMKSTTAVLLNLSRLNIFLGMKHFTSVLSLLGEFLTSNDDFLKSSVFNCLQNLFNSLLSKKNMAILFTTLLKKNNNLNEINIDPNELTLDVNLSKKSSNNNEVMNVLEQISVNLMYLISDRFDDLKPGFNLLHNFIEKITINLNNTAEEKNVINGHIFPLIENILVKLSENEKMQKTQTFKVFLGKIFNFVSSSLIIRLFPLQILDFDICSEEYTENSKVWVISFIEKFLRNDSAQTLKEFYESFTVVIEDLEKVLHKLKSNKRVKTPKEGMIIECDANKNDMMIDAENDEEDEDENFAIDRDESPHIRSIKIKRYELILQQIWGLLTKYTQWNFNYDLYVREIIKKLENVLVTYNKDANESIFIPNIKEIIFRVVSKLINTSFKFNDLKSLEIIKKEGKVFFSKCLTMIVNQKLSNSELKEGFNLISAFCKIMSEKFLFKIICDMIEKFDKSVQSSLQVNDNVSSSSNKAKLNESLNISLNEDMKVESAKKTSKTSNKKQRNKETNLLCLRIEIINYIVKNVHSFKAIENNSQTNIFALLNSFFEKFFFNDKLKSNSLQTIRKKLIDLFIILLSKVEQTEGIIEIFTKFANDFKGLDNLSAKQKAKIFEFIVDVLVKKFNTKSEGENIDVTECFSQLHILIEIVSLTKDMNRKVRNSSYEMIGKITDFMSESNLFNEWIKMILAILASNSNFLKSAAINALARIFWQKRSSAENSITKLLMETSNVILLLLKENNKELTKSIFLFIRVLLYAGSGNLELIKKIVNSIFNDTSEDIRKEFKVKIRNLLKNLIIKFSFEEIKTLIPKEMENLLAYINKYIVKKAKTMSKEEESVYGGNVVLDHSVMMDNDENLLDEEEEYIEKEFKKLDKRKNEEEKFFDRLDKLNIEEDDPEVIKKRVDAEIQKNEKMDSIEQLFKRDNIELENYFYVNPYAVTNTKTNKDKQDQPTAEKDKDVFYDKKKGKIYVKDFPVTLKDSKPKDKPSVVQNLDKKDDLDFTKPVAGNRFLNKKRVQNVGQDRDDFDDDDMDVASKFKISKRKTTHSTEKTNFGKKNTQSHVVKFSGDEYKNKAGKGDKLIQGKYEPFAYIQLNPKTTSHKNRKDALEIFKNVMHPEKQKK